MNEMNEIDAETFEHVEAAGKAAHAAIVRYAKKHGVLVWPMTMNTVGRLVAHVAANCDERDESQQLLEFLISSYAHGAGRAGFGIRVSAAGAEVASAPSATAGLH